jgi:hypothetical protein
MDQHSLVIIEVKQFLLESPVENIAVTARICEIKYITWTKSIARDKETTTVAERGGHKWVLNNQQEQTIQKFIWSKKTHEISLTPDIVYEAIFSMRQAYDYVAFFKEWFRKWYKRSNL